jgi:hypothetical protein
VLISLADGRDSGRLAAEVLAACSSGVGDAVDDDPAAAGFGGITSGPLVPQALIRTVTANSSHQGERWRECWRISERIVRDMAGR